MTKLRCPLCSRCGRKADVLVVGATTGWANCALRYDLPEGALCRAHLNATRRTAGRQGIRLIVTASRYNLRR